jgi:ADP-dependent NAD(P)H-hydrate dehydratase
MQIIESIPKLKSRPTESHKGDYGKVCIIAGSVGMSGAAALSGRAALRSGAGLVRVATPKSVLPIVASIEPSFTTIALPEDEHGRISMKAIDAILRAADENDALAIGPGMGLSRSLRSILEILLEQQSLRLLIDADGLNNLARLKNWPVRRKANLILTPHPGEMTRLWSGLFRQAPPMDRQELTMTFARQTGSTVVLKGAGTVVTNSEKVYINKTGNPGMASAGSGDVLAGVITALMGQKLSDFDAAVLGVYIHGLAGDIAAEKVGQISLMATDLIDALSEAFMSS